MAGLTAPLPPKLVRNVEREFGAGGVAWLGELPMLLERLAARWSLTLGPHFPELSYSYVAPATRGDGTPCVLKVGVPYDELRAEIESLGYWGGRGVVRLLDADPDEGALLLERVQPGTTLAELAERDDDGATRAAASMMRELWRRPPASHGLRDLSSWFRCLLGHRERHGGSGRFPAALFDRGEMVARELLASTEAPVLLHGDLHHFNILRAERAAWLAIDPKGLVGDRGFELGAFLRNPAPQSRGVLSRRLDILVDELGLDRRRARGWCFAEAMLNACWSSDEAEEAFRRKVEWAELMLML